MPTIKLNEKLTTTASPFAGAIPGSLVAGQPITWQLSAPNVVSISVAADGKSAVFTPIAPGTVTVSVSGNSIPFGPSFTSTFTITVEPPPADHFEFSHVVNPL